MDNLRGKTLKGLFWNLVERVGNQIISFVPTIFLARLLAPEQFGLIGMLSLFIAVATAFLDSGFGVALIQKKDATYVDECSMFYFNLVIGGVLTLALFLAAPLVADFYNQPILVGLTRALSFGILIKAFDLIQTTRLTRSLDFKTQLKATLLGTGVSGVIGISAAYLGLGVWSLVAQVIANDLISTAALWMMCPWRPALLFSVESLKGMFSFGSRMLSSSLIGTFFDNLHQVFIGKFFAAASLGYYTRAASMRGIVIDTTSSTLGRVMFPALASIQDDLPRLKRAYRRSMMLATMIHFPLMIGLIVVANPLINLLFSARWRDSVVFFQLMCVAGIIYPLHVINLDILKVKGRSDLFFQLELIKRSLAIVTLFITYRWGISAILTGQIVIALIAYILNSYYSEKLIDYPVKAQVVDVLPSLLIALLMGGGMYLAGIAMQSAGDFVLLVVQTGIGAILYFLLSLISRSEPLLELIELTRQLPLFGAGPRKRIQLPEKAE